MEGKAELNSAIFQTEFFTPLNPHHLKAVSS